MITREEYELSYILYEEDRILESTQESLDLKAITESQEYITEGLKENLRKYVNTVVSKVQQVWNKFKDKVQSEQLKYNKDEIEDAINNYAPELSVENYIVYDTDIFTKIDAVTLDYANMKDSLDNEEDFMKRYYTSFYSDPSKSIKDNLRNKCIKSKVDKYDLTQDDLKTMYEYMGKHKDIIDTIGKDLDAFNRAAKNTDYINFVVNSSSKQTNATPQSAGATTTQSTVSDSFMFIREDENDPAPKVVNSNPEPSNSNAPGENKDDQKNADAEGVKKVQLYFKCTTQVLSAKMALSREIYNFYNSVVTKHTANVKDLKVKKKNEEVKADKEESDKTPNQVEV